MRDVVFERWCAVVWQQHPHARLNAALDCTLPRDPFDDVRDGLAELRYELGRRRREAEADVDAGKPTGPASLERARRALELVDAYAVRVDESRLASIVVDSWSCLLDLQGSRPYPESPPASWDPPRTPGPMAREEARDAGELQRRGFGERVRTRLAEDVVLAGVLERYGVDGVYAYAELTQSEIEVVWLDHRGVDVQTIAEMTERPPSLVSALLRKARWRLQQLGSGSTSRAAPAAAG